MSADHDRPSPFTYRSRALGGLRAAAHMSPEERSARARKAALAGVAKREAERAAAGLPPRRKRAPEPSVEELEPWLEEVDRLHPDRQWPRDARRREAILLMRTAAAEAASDALKRFGA